MGSNTAIPWADDTFNPWWGCVEAGPECDNCYARMFAHRLGLELWGKDAPRRFFGDKHWSQPEKWNREAEASGQRRRVFCASQADVLEDRRDLDEHRARLWDLIERTPWLDWLLLTKRPAGFGPGGVVPRNWHAGHWPPNAWAGTSCGTQAGLARVRTLLEAASPAPVRFVSAEPLLEPVDFSSVMWPTHWSWDARFRTPEEALAAGARAERRRQALVLAGLRFVDWLIVGGESGAHHREMEADWVAEARSDCKAAGVPIFVKQDSGRLPGRQGRIPDELFVREFPEPRR